MTDSERARQRIGEVDSWYHCLEVAPGVETPGAYRFTERALAAYALPASLEGQVVLDVGAANGFFSFLFERRGAERVIATELRR